ncbi:CPBP family intramembrane glutamic endopeptidase [Frigoribacterium sp. PvP032]|uniref:CPBP family intramembrane glutamic endopeptidase n=1 Tax=Frigoribacterium sp. PvP032 TaxID=2806589 RepID=UPI001AE1B261|nr:CPBP family intramembrane glutamic endopeptidase [Frigoribacterium sp. PvP032]MBP1189602.1 membrane protease YdiL (CAAX protease family) [Frigoribacterium sp. PvP032]
MTTASVEYHRLFRTLPSWRWWRPLLAAVIGAVLYWVLANAVVLAIFAVLRAIGGQELTSTVAQGVQDDPLDASQPLVLLTTLASIATLLPAALLATKLAGLGRLGQLSSVTGRLRWRWMLRTLPAAVVLMALTVGLSYLVLPPLTGQAIGTGPVTTPPATIIWSTLVILLLVPLQASAEEFVFRGFTMQALGSWTVWPVVAIVLPTAAFALSHAYNPWGMLDVAVFGVAAAWLTWRTGGLEAAIVGHVLNNTVLFLLLAPFAGTETSDGSPLGLAVTVVCTPVWAWLVTRAFHRSGERRTSPGLPAGGTVHEEARVG